MEYISDLPKVKGRSILHHHIKQEKVVFVSLDLESGGERCGIVQLSAEILRPELDRAAGKVTKDVLASVKRDGTLYHPETNPDAGVFNKYLNPGEDAEWEPSTTEITGLSPGDERITSVQDIDEVCSLFLKWIEHNIKEDEVGVIVAYNGAGCDMKWLWRLCHAQNSAQKMHERLLHYMDPYLMMNKWKSTYGDQSEKEKA